MTAHHRHHSPLAQFDFVLAMKPTWLTVNGNSVDLRHIEPWRRLVESAGVTWLSAIVGGETISIDNRKYVAASVQSSG